MTDPKNYFGRVMFKLDDQVRFNRGLHELLSAVNPYWRRGIFLGDNLLTFSKNLSFLEDRPLMDALQNMRQQILNKALFGARRCLYGQREMD